jgi:hypothetical protein
MNECALCKVQPEQYSDEQLEAEFTEILWEQHHLRIRELEALLRQALLDFYMEPLKPQREEWATRTEVALARKPTRAAGAT